MWFVSPEKSHSEQFAKLVSEVREGRRSGKKARLNGSHVTAPISEATPPAGARAVTTAIAVSTTTSTTTTATPEVHPKSSSRDHLRGSQSVTVTRDRKGHSAGAENGRGQGSTTPGGGVDTGDGGESQISDEDVLILAADSLDVFDDPADELLWSKVEVSVYEENLDLTTSTIPERYVGR